MKKLYLCVFIFQFIAISAFANLYKGYIITLNGYHLTGQIGEIYLNENQKQVVFINDFGTPYMISPRLIAGFAYNDGDRLVTFQSLVLEKKWAFLEIINKGEGMTLMRTPEIEIELLVDAYGLSTKNMRGNEFYIQLKRKRPEKIKRLGFRKQMKQILGRRAPNLAKKIGTKGYRYNDLMKISEEYLEEYQTTRFIL